MAGDCHFEVQEMEDTGSSWPFISGFAFLFILFFYFFSARARIGSVNGELTSSCGTGEDTWVRVLCS